MPWTDQAKDDLGDHYFLNSTAPNVGDGTGLLAAGTVGNSELTLADTTLVATLTSMTQDEITYTGYLRPTQARTGAGWTSVDGAIANAALEQFGNMTAGGPVTALDFNLSLLDTVEFAIWFGVLDAPLVINNGVNPQFAIGALDLTVT